MAELVDSSAGQSSSTPALSSSGFSRKASTKDLKGSKTSKSEPSSPRQKSGARKPKPQVAISDTFDVGVANSTHVVEDDEVESPITFTFELMTAGQPEQRRGFSTCTAKCKSEVFDYIVKHVRCNVPYPSGWIKIWALYSIEEGLVPFSMKDLQKRIERVGKGRSLEPFGLMPCRPDLDPNDPDEKMSREKSCVVS